MCAQQYFHEVNTSQLSCIELLPSIVRRVTGTLWIMLLFSVYSEVSPEARNAVASPRLDFLAEPVPFKTWQNSKDSMTLGEISQPLNTVPPNALNAV